MNNTMEINHKVMPMPEPGMAWGSALKGGYTVQPPEAAPPSTNNEKIMMTLDAANQPAGSPLAMEDDAQMPIPAGSYPAAPGARGAFTCLAEYRWRTDQH